MTRIKEILSELTQQVIDGNSDALEAYIHIKDIEKYIKLCNEQIEPIAYQEADKFTEKVFTYKGAEIQKKNAAGRYDYSNVQLWKRANERQKQIEEMAKSALKGKCTIVDEESGEVIEPCIYTEGKAIISVSIKNK
jgi:hypothetical protein